MFILYPKICCPVPVHHAGVRSRPGGLFQVEGFQLPQHIEKRTITHLCRGIPALPQIYIFHIYTRPKFTQNPNPVEGTLSNMESKAKSGLSMTTSTMKLY